MKRIAVLCAGLAIAGCVKETREQEQTVCFSVVPNAGEQPHSHMMVNGCTGDTWLLVKSRMGDKPDDGYTFQWMKVARLDYSNPVLVNSQ